MKKLSIVIAVLSLFVLGSCASSHAPKEISPASTDFTDGGLAKLIEVVDEPCQLSYVKKDDRQYIMLKVKLRLTKESAGLQKVDPRDIDFTSLLSVATVNLVDENSIKLQELSVKPEDLLKLKKLLQKNVGDEETITFEGEFYDSKESSEWFEQADGFVPSVTGDVSGAEEETAESFGLNLTGKFGGADDAVLTYDETADDGVIEFTINGVKNVRKVKMGSYNKNTHVLILREYFVSGKYVGDFDGIWKDGVYKGVFTNTKGGSVNFTLQGTGNTEFSGTGNSSYVGNAESAGSGSEDMDALLASYEEYVDKYISYLKKAKNGDMTALVEYPSLMQKAEEFCEKLEKVKGDMSSSQLERLNKISRKMMKAMQEM